LAHPDDALLNDPIETNEVEQNEAEVDEERQYWAYDGKAHAIESFNKRVKRKNTKYLLISDRTG
jgi:hypothetical protein